MVISSLSHLYGNRYHHNHRQQQSCHVREVALSWTQPPQQRAWKYLEALRSYGYFKFVPFVWQSLPPQPSAAAAACHVQEVTCLGRSRRSEEREAMYCLFQLRPICLEIATTTTIDSSSSSLSRTRGSAVLDAAAAAKSMKISWSIRKLWVFQLRPICMALESNFTQDLEPAKGTGLAQTAGKEDLVELVPGLGKRLPGRIRQQFRDSCPVKSKISSPRWAWSSIMVKQCSLMLPNRNMQFL